MSYQPICISIDVPAYLYLLKDSSPCSRCIYLCLPVDVLTCILAPCRCTYLFMSCYPILSRVLLDLVEMYKKILEILLAIFHCTLEKSHKRYWFHCFDLFCSGRKSQVNYPLDVATSCIVSKLCFLNSPASIH